MNGFFGLQRKSDRKVIGILSGTSVDAVDAVLVNINNSFPKIKLSVLDFRSYPMRKDLKEKILAISERNSGHVDDICRFNVIIGMLFGRCINNLLKSNKLDPKDIDLIGSHGQTIHHLPKTETRFGFRTGSTLQIGDPSVIANVTGITTIGDFRIADVAAGGSGAPLVPYLDYALFRSSTKNRLLVNIGGISNVTHLPKSLDLNRLVAFDTGPGNMVIDAVVNKLFGMKYDKDGSIAARGNIQKKLLEQISEMDEFYLKKPPKSTGREQYGKEFVRKILHKARKVSKEDIVATVTEFTAFSIYHNVRKLETDEVLVSGGGSMNKALMNCLNSYFNKSNVKVLDQNGINSKNKEAVLFALLANEIASGRKANVKSVTGAKRNVYLGKICPA